MKSLALIAFFLAFESLGLAQTACPNHEVYTNQYGCLSDSNPIVMSNPRLAFDLVAKVKVLEMSCSFSALRVVLTTVADTVPLISEVDAEATENIADLRRLDHEIDKTEQDPNDPGKYEIDHNKGMSGVGGVLSVFGDLAMMGKNLLMERHLTSKNADNYDKLFKYIRANYSTVGATTKIVFDRDSLCYKSGEGLATDLVEIVRRHAQKAKPKGAVPSTPTTNGNQSLHPRSSR